MYQTFKPRVAKELVEAEQLFNWDAEYKQKFGEKGKEIAKKDCYEIGRRVFYSYYLIWQTTALNPFTRLLNLVQSAVDQQHLTARQAEAYKALIEDAKYNLVNFVAGVMIYNKIYSMNGTEEDITSPLQWAQAASELNSRALQIENQINLGMSKLADVKIRDNHCDVEFKQTGQCPAPTCAYGAAEKRYFRKDLPTSCKSRDRS